ncbi:flagellar protein FliS [Mobilisporobacter senegalensis]|uniref:Flagellar protein FliS n=1 Tax=Mobilisporobacter senegalensis TaxID=1329262 RepID=A0A3N1XA95_9FIRM|nr:flagellar protein FliS [Mobilisporobacter senegalensis]ROR23686.1 flagellar protein FliS [Mobilisporobacter senegalensis]
MDSVMTQTYAARVSQANRSELIVIMYEIILEDLKNGIKAYENSDIKTFGKELKHAQKFVSKLINSLDFKYVMSYDLMQLYLYTNKRIIAAIIKKKPDDLESAIKVMNRLLVGFEGVAKEDTSEPLMQNTQQLYAGLTYGKGTLNETYIDPKQHSRGFKA